jgi:glutaredoxin
MLTVYSKKNCAYCDQAKELLTRRGVEFKEVKIDEDATAKAFILSEGHRSVPQIYNGDKLFVDGGFMGLLNLNPAEMQAKLAGTKEEYAH